MRAPVSRSRPPFSLGLRLVGLGPCGCRRSRLGGRARARPRGWRRWRSRSRSCSWRTSGAGGDLQAAELLLGQRGLLVGVVLATGQHAPEQDRELAGGRDDRLAVPAAGAGAVIEGV